jgi:hypothetical protein
MTDGRISGHGNGSSSVLLAFFLALLLVQGCGRGPGQASSFKVIFDRYRDREGILAVSFPPGLVGIFLNENDPDQAALKGLFSELSTFRMLSVQEGSQDEMLLGELKTTVTEFTQQKLFTDLFRVQTAGEDIFIRVKEDDGKIREAILMFGASN